MCGIFGIAVAQNSDLPLPTIKQYINTLFRLSESRGKEASGIVVRAGSQISVVKDPSPATKLIKKTVYSSLFSDFPEQDRVVNSKPPKPFTVLGHSRLVTSGKSELNTNNQPVIKDGSVGIHNGVIVNEEKIWRQYPALSKIYDVDTEVIFSLLQMFRHQGQNLIEATQSTFRTIDGSASVAVLFEDTNTLLLATNTGSLYMCQNTRNDMLVFASEKHILDELIRAGPGHGSCSPDSITQIRAGECCLVTLESLEIRKANLQSDFTADEFTTGTLDKLIPIHDISEPQKSLPPIPKERYQISEKNRQSMLSNWARIVNEEIPIRRCTRCVLPETMPYISFDDEGICNYCRNFEIRKTPLKGENALQNFVSQYQSKNGEPDCIVGFSGGRDSTYGIDYIKNTLNLHPIAFTYDWAMVNDLARRNQARVVSRLGLEQIIVSADIKRKRGYIRKNLTAWLKKPDLGMVPLLMAGDKEFYYYFHKIRQQTGVKLFVFCGGHEIEETPFKYGFCNVDHGVNTVMNCLTGISYMHKLKMLLYFARQYITNPSYINSSIFDTFFAYYCTYLLKDDYLYLYHYIEWDEKQIISSIRERFDWELAEDTNATWRTDDGTAAFYNYIYLTMAGFTEFDNFRSYQVREGKITRTEALELIREENQPRFDAIEWYAEAIDIDVNHAIDVINNAKKLYTIPGE
nr:hypothetical protein [uncultured Methanoregula sp.]